VRLSDSLDPLDRVYTPATASEDALVIVTSGEIDSTERLQLMEFMRLARTVYQSAQAAAAYTQPNPFAGLPYEKLLAEHWAAKSRREPQPTADIA
jgi:hypothetical protein